MSIVHVDNILDKQGNGSILTNNHDLHGCVRTSFQTTGKTGSYSYSILDLEVYIDLLCHRWCNG
jgi:hypothetical protein